VPEGDTIHNAARRLRPVLEGATLRHFEAPRLAGTRPRPGETIDGVEAVGKHLLIHFSGGLTLETHLRMTGVWHVYRQGDRWRRPRHLLRCRIVVEGHEAVCFAAPVVRTHPTARFGTAIDPLARLGPDLCLDASDSAEVVQQCVTRMASLDGDTPIGEVLLDQRVGNGIGNVYKSEVCWHCHVDPFARLDAVVAAERTDLISTAGRLLRANLGPGRRRTVAEGLAVYGRVGQPCRRCGTRVRRHTEGELARVTYWCPTCQPRRRAQTSGT
jgi:endonuclease VIII